MCRTCVPVFEAAYVVPMGVYEFSALFLLFFYPVAESSELIQVAPVSSLHCCYCASPNYSPCWRLDREFPVWWLSVTAGL